MMRVVVELTKLKQRPGKNIAIAGSATWSAHCFPKVSSTSKAAPLPDRPGRREAPLRHWAALMPMRLAGVTDAQRRPLLVAHQRSRCGADAPEGPRAAGPSGDTVSATA